MAIVIPMAGRGERFRKKGYNKPKMLLEAHGKTMLEWSVDSLPLEQHGPLIFVYLKEHDNKYQIRNFLKNKYGHRIPTAYVALEDVTRGQAETVFLAREFIDPDDELLIFNIDTFFVSNSLALKLTSPEKMDGILGCFNSNEARFSFALTDSQGIVVKTAEKEAISENALTGLYHFSKARDFLQIAETWIKMGQMDKGEFYVAPMYNDLIAKGRKYVLDFAEEHWILGTPEEYEIFLKQYNSG